VDDLHRHLTIICRFADLDPEERAGWEAEFANDRLRAGGDT
jgi:hypothetical protein